MSDVLTRICKDKRQHIARCKETVSLADLEARIRNGLPPRGFFDALMSTYSAGRTGLICEIKMASPSKGLIRADFDPAQLARAYQAGGASCLSVLTDEPYFMGCDDYLVSARNACSLPVLRKDFMLDPYQVTEARALGADCILLIMAALDPAQADDLAQAALSLDMDILVEIHDRSELEMALNIPSRMIGINNRNLKTLKVDLQTTIDLAQDIPEDRLVVAESGLFTKDDLDRCADVGVNTFLIGESLMRQQDVTVATRQLLGETA
ncbi:indole-3-glycerol phosphate synthase [Iodidimonas muriae]|uniref:Indole-3-glycerol phosphate synthase n=1 Tax=Iodidimonas muriae TaxID=261467 RepID=A0ABQ2LEA9_9PROT|nr:indole-3-glycerol phosphate synthase TrpC [Iodidimonas muriae]GER06975.1 indole-3-glycerol phosphate synthase [Kordiimonadales bacterium JCM 17843]GGO13536.1 indole-3-glycerol phosphate synthase [Iodidimonas muriae]